MVKKYSAYLIVILVSLFLFSPVSAFSLPELLQENGQVRNIDIPVSFASQQHGIMGGAKNPDVDVYVFADVTETNYSGKILTKNIAELLTAYPTKVRVWYIHTVLPDRDTPNTRTAIITMTCLAKEGMFWNNITKIVETQGKWDTNYPVPHQEAYLQCLQEVNNKTTLDTVVQQGQKYIGEFGLIGVPASVFVSVKNPTHGIVINGAYPVEIYKEAVEQIQIESKKQNETVTTPALYPLSNNVQKLTVWVRFKQFVQSLFRGF